MKLNFKKQSGQGLMELIVAIGVIVVGLFSVWALFLSNFSAEHLSQERIVAANLAREAVEAVKNIRDSNWLAIDVNEQCGGELCAWNNGLEIEGDNTGTIEFDFVTGGVVFDRTADDLDDGSTMVYLNRDNFFVQSANDGLDGLSPTRYHRLVTLQGICCVDNSPTDSDGRCDNSDFYVAGYGEDCQSGDLLIGLDVQATVSWRNENNETKQVTINDQFYNWR